MCDVDVVHSVYLAYISSLGVSFLPYTSAYGQAAYTELYTIGGCSNRCLLEIAAVVLLVSDEGFLCKFGTKNVYVSD